MTVLRAEGHSNCWSRVPVQDGLEPQFIDLSQGFSTNLKTLLGDAVNSAVRLNERVAYMAKTVVL